MTRTLNAAPAGVVLSPIILPANQPVDRPYRGGAGIARFRHTEQASPFTPEDFVASTTEVYAGNGVGLSLLDGGRTLRDAVIEDPIGYFGEEHVRRFGARTMLLVKLLDTAERLFVHYHPDDAFAQSMLRKPMGKTEAWIVVDTDDEQPAYANLGFSRKVSEIEVERWVTEQDVDDMLGAMNRVELTVGSTLLVPAGLPHAIGPGITLVELQQPTDLSILLEYKGYGGLGLGDALLGLDLQSALGGLDRRRWDAEQLAVLGSGRPEAQRNPGDTQLFPDSADEFFAASWLSVTGQIELGAGFSVLVIVAGHGSIEYDGGEIPVARGMTVLVPFAAGPIAIRGDLQAVRCRPPL